MPRIMNKKIHLAIGVGSICSSKGGTERAATGIANAMLQRGHKVTIFYNLHKGLTVPLYHLDRSVKILCYSGEGSHTSIQGIRNILTELGIDVFLSMESSSMHLLWAMCTINTNIPFICSERNAPRYIEAKWWNKHGRYAVLSGADCIHELLQEYITDVPEHFRQKTRVICNVAPDNTPKADAAGFSDKRKILLYMARFDVQKRPDLLLDAFKLLQDPFPDWDLYMWGSGVLEKAMRRKTKRLDLVGRVFFNGLAEDGLSKYSTAQIFCLPSEYEGCPNTVLEAMSAGLPVVGYRSCSGLADLVEDGVNGLLAPELTAKSLASALGQLMESPSKRRTMGLAGLQKASSYAPEVIYGQWESLFLEVAEKKGRTQMNALDEEPFASRARLSAAARREWIFRNFGEPMPYTCNWLTHNMKNLFAKFIKI